MYHDHGLRVMMCVMHIIKCSAWGVAYSKWGGITTVTQYNLASLGLPTPKRNGQQWRDPTAVATALSAALQIETPELPYSAHQRRRPECAAMSH